ICVEPKEMAMPRIAAMHQPQEMRFAMAMAPSTMTRMMAMGVSQARMFASRAVAPVMNGDADWAAAISGTVSRQSIRIEHAVRRCILIGNIVELPSSLERCRALLLDAKRCRSHLGGYGITRGDAGRIGATRESVTMRMLHAGHARCVCC